MNLFRKGKLAKKILVTDGLPGCGKTMLSPILSSLDRVEMYYFAFEIEFIVRMNYLKKISNNAAEALIKMLVDYKLYNSMMSREVNFRTSDLSSVANHHNYKKYLKRLNSAGDHLVPDKIKKEKPILHMTTHDLLNYSDIFIKSLKERVVYVEMIRHPVDMINQQYFNMKNHYNNPRSIQVEFFHKNKPLPYWSLDWKNKFLKLNNINRAIYNICNMMKKNVQKRKKIKDKIKNNYIVVPFERFTSNPEFYLKTISKKLNTKITNKTLEEMKKQKVPRDFFFKTPSENIYKKTGGHIKEGRNRDEDLLKKYNLFKSYGATPSFIELLKKASKDYEKIFSIY